MANVYFEYLKENRIPYDIIYLNRYHEKETTGAVNDYAIDFDTTSNFGKIKSYLSFQSKAASILRNNKYGFIIVWGELTAALLANILRTEYANRYCVNVRDLFVGLRSVLNLQLVRAIKKAAFVTVPSEKYLEELDSSYDNYLFIHSYNKKIMLETNEIALTQNNVKDQPINILFIGNIRFYNHLIRFIEQIKNDLRYVLTVAGSASEPIREYVEKNKILNVKVYGAFPTKDTAKYLSDADVIYNLYGTEDINLRYALSNKLYYAIALNLPILVYKNTYMFELSNRCGIGFAVDDYLDGSFANAFYEWYHNRNIEETKRKCDAMIQDAIRTQDNLIQQMNEIKYNLL